MKVYLLIDEPEREASQVVAVYATRWRAQRRMDRLNKARLRWEAKQKKHDEEGSDEAWATCPPNHFQDLYIQAHTVVVG